MRPTDSEVRRLPNRPHTAPIIYVMELTSANRERVISRNSAAWNWTYERTAERVDDNDMPNALLVAKTQVYADRVIQSVNDAAMN